MDRTRVHVQIAHPNLAPTSDGLEGAYDVVIAKSEKFVTPRGVKGTATIFSRVSPERIKDDKTGRLRAAATEAKAAIEHAIGKLKYPPEKKSRLLSLMSALVKSNISDSSKEFFAADGAHLIRPALHVSGSKLVRFADEPPTEMPASRQRSASLPSEVILPELPPEE
jgi:hypothetical protein